MRTISLTKDAKAIVDDEDFEWLNQWKWCYCNGYAVRGTYNISHQWRLVYMHNVIMNTPLGFDTDHVNRKRSDNRKSNLRVVSHADNMLNRTIQSNNRHGYKGVSPTPTGRWAAKFRGKYLGTFDTPQEASKAYSTAFNFA